MIVVKNYVEPQFCEKEILRYSGYRGEDAEILELLHSCIGEVREKLSYKVCYTELDMPIETYSQMLLKNLEGCSSVIVFAATIGVEIDRLIAKYGRISPSRALMMQAIGAERIEALCDEFCKYIENEKKANLTLRFSPGYGDLPLEEQKYIFDILDCSRKIGVTLNDSFLMSPSKSVTAYVGISNKEVKKIKDKCSLCEKADCSYRGVK